MRFLQATNITNDVHGYHSGQTNGTLHAMEGGQQVGHLDYAKYHGRALIQHVVAEVRGRGVGPDLVRYLANLVGGYDKVDWGVMTGEGYTLQKKMDREFGYEPPITFDADALVSSYGGRIKSRDDSRTDEGFQQIYVELRDPGQLKPFLTAVENLAPGLNPDPYISEVDSVWVEVIVPSMTRAKLKGHYVDSYHRHG